MRKNLFVVLVSAAMLLMAGTAWAATANQSLSVSATVATLAELTLTPTSISFANTTPTGNATIPANSTVAVTADARTGTTDAVTLTCTAAGDLTSGTDIIAITALKWTAAGTGFVAGTMNKTTAQDVASWVGSGNRTGTLTFALDNSWDYNNGSYAATVNYTLTAP